MTDPKPGTRDEPAAEHASREPLSEQAVREEVRELTREMLRSGKVDAERVREVGRAMSAGFGGGEQPAEPFADAIRRLDEALLASSAAAHEALARLAAQGDAAGETELRDALAQLGRLQADHAAAVARVGAAASDDLQRDFRELMSGVQKLGTDAGAQLASMFNEFSGRMSTLSRESTRSGLEATREIGMRAAFLTSGILAGIADALSEQPRHDDPR